MNPQTVSMTDGQLTITRTIHAPRELVWQAFTERERLAHWWGPKGFELIVESLDLRPEGRFHYQMRSPEGFAMWGRFTYVLIDPPQRLEYISSFADAEGNLIPVPFPGGWPDEIFSRITLEDQGSKTLLTLNAWPHNASDAEKDVFVANADSLNQGFGGTFDKLDTYVDRIQHEDREIVIERIVDAPPALAFRAWTDLESVSAWWGPDGFQTTTISSDFRVGGQWRFTMVGPDGKVWPNRITYREIIPGELLSYFHNSDIDDDPEQFEVWVTFHLLGERQTRIVLTCRLASPEQKDAKVKFGAVQGGQQTLGRFADHLGRVYTTE